MRLRLQRRLAAALCFVFAASAPSAQAQSITTELVTSLSGTPVYVTAAPGDDRLFIVDQGGFVRVVDGGVLLPTPYLDISAQTDNSFYTGFRGLTFHPNYATNGFLYVAYDHRNGSDRDIVVDRYEVMASDPNRAEPSSQTELLRVTQVASFHGGGNMHFGPDGMFYVAFGDGTGTGNDPACNAQSGSTMLGKMLRLDVDSATPYAIPADNPFVGDPSVLDEIWHIGFRHPWRWSFDALTGDAYIADVGQHSFEEVDFQPAGVGGLNYGWKVMEGSNCFSTSSCAPATSPCNDPAYTGAIHQYATGSSCSITGGFVYRGSAIPGLYGAYLFGDWCSGRVWSLRYDGTTVTELMERTSELGGPFNGLTSFGEDSEGELYIVQGSGAVRRIVPDCGTTLYCATTPNSHGAGALISSSGSPSIGANDFTLEVTAAAPGQMGIFYYGDSQTNLPFGAGLRCIGGNAFRLKPALLTAAVDGSASRLLDFNSLPASGGAREITPGSVWNFQFWYRDPAGLGFNLSNGLSVTFCP